MRYYDSNAKLQGIISLKDRTLDRDIDKSDFLWKRMEQTESLYKYSFFRSFKRDRNFVMVEEYEEVIYDCKSTESFFFYDCYMLVQQPLMNSSSCNPMLEHKIALLTRNIPNPSFRHNVFQNDNFYRQRKSLYPFCKQEETFNRANIRKSVETWWKSVSFPDKDPVLFHTSSTEPFKDLDNPHIQINLNYFVGRIHLENNTYKIFSHAKHLHTGKMINAKIYANISTWNTDDWTGPIKIVIGEFKSTALFGSDIDELISRNFVIHGRLYRSKLHGLVRIFGTIPSDPEDICEKHFTPGLGFLGHYNNGVPSGYCWKRLLGGPWIYGKVDEKGHFSGDDIAYINQDVLTSFKGTFHNGVMIKAKSVEVIGEKCNEEGIKMLEFSAPLSSTAEEYHFERPTSETFGDQPLILDPLDKRYVQLGESGINTGEKSQGIGQNGAFANIDITPGTVISHINGYIFNEMESKILMKKQAKLIHKKKEFYNKFKENEAVMNDIIETLRESSLKYRAERKCGHMDIPYEAGQDTTIYNSTRGHKINHSFGGSNTCLHFHDSARFGIVNSIISSGGVTIPKGTELFEKLEEDERIM